MLFTLQVTLRQLAINRRLPSTSLTIFRSYSFAKKSSQTIDTTHDTEASNVKKTIKVAVIGAPNAGKSSFINSVMHQRICPISRKVHTTQTHAKAISTENNVQMVLFDTPGMTTVAENQKYKLGNQFVRECHVSIEESDLIAVVHDVSNSHTRNALHPTVLETLITYKTIPSILVMNKVDNLPPKRVLLDLVRILTEETVKCKQRKYVPWKGREDSFLADMSRPVKYKNPKPAGWPYFTDVFMVSALTGDGVQHVADYLSEKSTERSWEYPDFLYTDQKIDKMILENVRAVCLDFLPNEIPYTITCEMEAFEIKNNRIVAHVNISSSKDRYARVICGYENKRIQQITEVVSTNVQQLYNMDAKIILNVVDNERNKVKNTFKKTPPNKLNSNKLY